MTHSAVQARYAKVNQSSSESIISYKCINDLRQPYQIIPSDKPLIEKLTDIDMPTDMTCYELIYSVVLRPINGFIQGGLKVTNTPPLNLFTIARN